LWSTLRTDDYTDVVIDPADGSFWAANQSTTTAVLPPPPRLRIPNWGTWVSQFTISSANSVMMAAAPSLAQGLTTSGAQGGTLLFIADPLGTIVAPSTAGNINGSGMRMESHTAPVASTPDSLAAGPSTSGAVRQIAAASSGVSSSNGLDSPTGDSNFNWIELAFLANLNLAWI